MLGLILTAMVCRFVFMAGVSRAERIVWHVGVDVVLVRVMVVGLIGITSIGGNNNASAEDVLMNITV